MSVIVPIIVVAIIALQIYFFIKNVNRMKEYRQIFEEDSSWNIAHNGETGFVSGIDGDGNEVFESIKESINKYLNNNSGSVIDFHLLKDAVDRHCDSVENDINALTPVPLYCGLAGTMAGVIVGLSSLLYTGSITTLLSSGSGNFGAAANGVNDLLSGVAWAMLASICGIFFTTLSSILFKRYKLEEESGKNTFLAWLQATLLPELPSDTSDALNKLVKNLNRFNATFANNTTELRGALREVNQSYQIQADIIKAVHDMDVMKMAKANVNVLKELKDCTDKLEQFNEYLNDIHGYTDAIHDFTTKFDKESNRLYILEEIQQFFMRHKAEIAKDSADADIALKDALITIKETANENANELNKVLVQQAETFKNIIAEEKETFYAISTEMKTQFCAQISQMPMLERKLSEISEIPGRLDKLIDRVEKTNKTLATDISQTMQSMANGMLSNEGGTSFGPQPLMSFPKWMKWTIVVSVVLIALTCVSNTAYRIWTSENNSTQNVEQQSDSAMPVDTLVVDTVSLQKDTIK